jgi:predicted Zn-dependent protease with MMP-like domain
MTRAQFEQLVEEALAELPARYRKLLDNVVVMVEDYPSPRAPDRRLPPGARLLGEFYGIPRTKKTVFEPGPPDQIRLYQKNIEAVCETEQEIREQVRLTVQHELGHFFGLSEEELQHL